MTTQDWLAPLTPAEWLSLIADSDSDRPSFR